MNEAKFPNPNVNFNFDERTRLDQSPGLTPSKNPISAKCSSTSRIAFVSRSVSPIPPTSRTTSRQILKLANIALLNPL